MLVHENSSPTKPSRVVIIGAGGFVGGTIKQHLESEAIPTLPVTRKEIDLLDDDAPNKLNRWIEPSDSVVFVSAIAPAKTITMLMQNLRMAETVCRVLANVNIAHLVYISSDAVYADDANPVTEESPCSPTTLHGMMHAARELILKHSTAAPVALLRPTLLYGARDPHNGYGPNRFRREAIKGGPVTIFGEGEEQRDHVLVDDIAKLTALVLTHRSAGILNVATGSSISFYDIAHRVAKQYGVTVKSQPRSGPRPHLLHRFFDITQCIKAFPMFHYTPLETGLEIVRKTV